MISPAPASRAASTARQPIGPQPDTSTLLPSSDPARDTACRQTASGSHTAASDRSVPGDSRTACRAGSVTACRNSPCSCGIRIAEPLKRMSEQWLAMPARQ